MEIAAKERDLIERTKRFIKAELKRADITYEELAERLREHGLEETKGSIAAKISRGAFPATFFIAVMKAIGVEQVRLEDV
jgi:3-mercaptopyruvate sulfurtransferase SseA